MGSGYVSKRHASTFLHHNQINHVVPKQKLLLYNMELKRRNVSLAGIACFLIWRYSINRIPTLRWVTYAFIVGLVLSGIGAIALLFLTSRGIRKDVRNSIRRPKGLAFVAPSFWQNEIAALRARQIYEKEPLYPKSRIISNALDDILELVCKDFVNSWYSSISKNPVFINQVDKLIRLALADIRDRFLDLDFTAILTTRLVPILTAHFRDYYEAERAIRGKYLNRAVTESEELDLAIAARYHNGELHPAASLSQIDTKLNQLNYLRGVAKDLLPQLLPQSSLSSRAASVLINELVVCAILLPIMQLLVEPDTWNQLIESYGHSMLEDRSTVKRLRFALDQHALPPVKTSRTVSFPRLAPGDNEKKFEKFIRAIRKANNISDIRRFRSEISSQLKKDSVQGQDPVYLKRLDIGRRILNQRVNKFTPRENKPSSAYQSSSNGISRLENASLVDLLHDTSGLTYFMEFMDRQNLMSLVQFWIVVDGIRTPLEDDLIDDEACTSLRPWTEADRNDLAQIYNVYFSKSELMVSDASKQIVQEFLKAGKRASSKQYYLARKEVLKAQTTILEAMKEKYFGNFKKSDLFYKCLTSQETIKPQMQNNSPLTPSSSDVSIQKNHIPTRVHSLQTMPSGVPNIPKVSNKVATKRYDSSRCSPSSLDSMTTHDGTDPNQCFVNSSNPENFALNDEYVVDNEEMDSSIFSLDQEANNHVPDKKVMQAMETAFNFIMEDKSNVEDLKESLNRHEINIQSKIHMYPSTNARKHCSQDRSELFGEKIEKPEKNDKPNISSLGLVNMSSRIGVFSDDDLFPDEEKFMSDEHDDPIELETCQDDEVHEAAPGDLGLTEAITGLNVEIERLENQEAVVDSMTRKAELTNNIAELRILKKSKASLQREIRHKELQRQQYVIQESDNGLYGRSTIRIKSILFDKEDDGREYASYVIEIQRNAGHQMPAASWTINRRYSEFLELHQKLRERYTLIRNSDFPRRRMVLKLQSEFLQKRKLGLEKYLRELLLLPEVCRSRELRTFLSENGTASASGSLHENEDNKKDLISRIFNSITDGMEDILGSIPVLDQVSLAGQDILSAATQQLMNMPANLNENSLNAAEAEAELNAFENKELEPFVKPICDIFLEVFELNRGNNWLRGRAVVVVLHQLLGGTIERKVRDNIRGLCCEDTIIKYIGYFRESIWPGGKIKTDRKCRTPAERSTSKAEAAFMLNTIVPDLAASVVGRVNAQAASRRIFATFNNSRLNVHLVFTLLDEIIDVLFNEKGI